MHQEDFINFQIDMNSMYNFLISKSMKEIGGHITSSKIDGNNWKTKKLQWTILEIEGRIRQR